MSINTPRHIACQDCDLIQALPELPARASAVCRRCDAVLYAHKPNSLERALACGLAGAILFIVANMFPFLSLELQGKVTHTTLSTGVTDLFRADMIGLALLVCITTLLIPLLEIGGMLLILVPLTLGYRPRYIAPLFRTVRQIQPWSMMEVFMLGVLVSIVKLGAMAKIFPGVALWAFALMIIVVAAASAVLNPEDVWRRLETEPK